MEENKYAGLSYNPADLEKNRVYFDRLHKSYLESYKSTKFENNAEDMDIIMQDVVYAYISNVSNVYIYGVEYGGLRDESGNYPKWLQNAISEKVKFEQYYRLDRQSLLYTYLVMVRLWRKHIVLEGSILITTLILESLIDGWLEQALQG